jgi:ribokinase
MKILTVGGAMIDTIAIIDSDRIERMTMLNAESSFLLLEEGRKTEAEEVSTHPGGGAVNAAVAMARLGIDVAVLAKLGNDARAEAILARLAEEGISSQWTKRDGRAPTGASVLVSSHDRNAAIFTFRGANTLLEVGDLHDDAFAVDVVYIANLSNQSADCFPAIVSCAKAHDALVAANPGPRQLSARGQAFLESLAAIDILALNRTEADLLVPILVARSGEGGPTLGLAPGEEAPALAARGLAGGGFEMGIAAYFRALTRLGPQHVVITDGARGAFAGSPQEILFAPALKTKAVGTAGAGDAFAATFVAYVALGRPIEEALRAATINSTSVVGHIDTQTGLLQRRELDRRLAALPQSAVRRWAA